MPGGKSEGENFPVFSPSRRKAAGSTDIFHHSSSIPLPSQNKNRPATSGAVDKFAKPGYTVNIKELPAGRLPQIALRDNRDFGRGRLSLFIVYLDNQGNDRDNDLAE